MNPAILVLVVEDDTLIQQLVKEALEEGGFKSSLANTAQQAIAMLDTEAADYQALITDIDLIGELTGWDVAKHAREINDALPVIYMTVAVLMTGLLGACRTACCWSSRSHPLRS